MIGLEDALRNLSRSQASCAAGAALLVASLVSASCGSGGSGAATDQNAVQAVQASVSPGLDVVTIQGSGQGTSQSVSTFSVAPGSRSIVVQTNIDGTDDPMLTGTQVRLSSPSGGRQAGGFSIAIGNGSVSYEGGTALPPFSSAVADYEGKLQGLTNVTSASASRCDCTRSNRQAVPSNLRAFVINPEPGTWRIEVDSQGGRPFTVGVVAASALGSGDPSASRAVSGSRARSRCSWWVHSAIDLACEASVFGVEDTFIEMAIALGIVQPETIPADAAVIIALKAAYVSNEISGCGRVADSFCEGR